MLEIALTVRYQRRRGGAEQMDCLPSEACFLQYAGRRELSELATGDRGEAPQNPWASSGKEIDEGVLGTIRSR